MRGNANFYLAPLRAIHIFGLNGYIMAVKKYFKLKSEKLTKLEEKCYLHRIVAKEMAIVYCEYKKGWEHINIKHISEEFLYIIKGHLTAKVGKESYVLKTGDGLLIPSNVPHTFVALKNTTALVTFAPPITAKQAKKIIKKGAHDK